MCRSVVFAVLYYSTSMYSFISTRSSIQTVGCDENTNGEVWIKLRSNTGCEHEYESSFIILFCKVCNSCDSTDTNSIQNDGIMLSRNTKQTTKWLFRDEMKCHLKNNTRNPGYTLLIRESKSGVRQQDESDVKRQEGDLNKLA